MVFSCFRTVAGTAILLVGVLAACAAPRDDSTELSSPPEAPEFEPTSTVDETLRRHRAIPTE